VTDGDENAVCDWHEKIFLQCLIVHLL